MTNEQIGTYEPWQSLPEAQERIAELERENAELRERLVIRDDLADAVRAIYNDVPVSNWTRKPLRVIRDWLRSVGKQVSL